jgi:hypothetical protein
VAKARKSPVRRSGLVLNADQAEVLTEIATLVSYSDGFTYTNDMMALNKRIAGLSAPAARRDFLAQAAAREAIR